MRADEIAPANTITEVTRREIIDFLSMGEHSWHGRLSELEFLRKIFDLKSLPSTGRRRGFKNAADDIRRHRVDNPEDWSEDWVFYYSPFDILGGPDERFLQFLCQTLHPAVRPKSDEAQEMVRFYNEQLSVDGWEIVEETRISNRPVYASRPVQSNVVTLGHASSEAEPGTPTSTPAFKSNHSSEAHASIPDSLDFTSEAGRCNAIAAYTKRWTTDSWVCTAASLARTAIVDPADLSKWKKGSLPQKSDKKSRIEKTLRDNTPPTPPAGRRKT
jgi:hypothetical protein